MINEMNDSMRIALGIILLAKYEDSVCADHDVIYAGPDGTIIEPSDEKLLREYGWHIECDVGRWAFYV